MANFFENTINWEVMPISYDTFINISGKIIYSILIIIIGIVINKIFNRFIKKFEHKRTAKIDNGAINTLSTLLKSVTRYVIYFFVVFYILKLFGVSVESLLTIAGIGSVAIGFGAQSLVKDLISGAFILFEGQYTVGEKVEIQGNIGTVEAFGIRSTTIRSSNGNRYIIPNGEIKTITNLTNGSNLATVYIRVGYDDDVEKILKILQDEMEKVNLEQIQDTPTVLGITEFGEHTMQLQINANCNVQTSAAVERELRRIILKRLKKEGCLNNERIYYGYKK